MSAATAGRHQRPSRQRPSRLRAMFSVRKPGNAIAAAVAEAHEDPEMTLTFGPLRETLQQAAPLPPEPADTALLRRVADGLRAMPSLPGAYLRNVTHGDGADPHEPLKGFPSFAGMDVMPDGTPVAGLWLGDADKDGHLVLDVVSAAYCDAAACAFLDMRDALMAAALEEGDGEAA